MTTHLRLRMVVPTLLVLACACGKDGGDSASNINEGTGGIGGTGGTSGTGGDGGADCVPKTCSQLNATCGAAPDGCNGTVDCGDCPPGTKCGGGGPNTCGTADCVPKTCVALGASCGIVSDGCSATLDCGACVAPETCEGNGVKNQCGCVCTRDHAWTTCDQAGCVIDACDDGFADCNNNDDDGCETSLSAKTDCGACGHDCLGGNCTAGKCQPVLLHTGAPWRLAVDGTHVYFEDMNDILRVPLAGGDDEAVATGGPEGDVDGFAIDATNVFWADFGYNEIRSVSKSGAEFSMLIDTDACAEGCLAVSATHVFFACASSGEIVRVPVEGGSGFIVSAGNAYPYGVATDGQWVWFTNYGEGLVRRVSVNGMGTEIDIAASQFGPGDITVEPGTVYWTNFAEGTSDGAVMSAPSAGGAVPTILAHSQEQPAGIAVDSVYAYWVTHVDDGAVLRVPKGGGAVETLADSQSYPSHIAVDDTSVYWTTQDEVLRLAK